MEKPELNYPECLMQEGSYGALISPGSWFGGADRGKTGIYSLRQEWRESHKQLQLYSESWSKYGPAKKKCVPNRGLIFKFVLKKFPLA